MPWWVTRGVSRPSQWQNVRVINLILFNFPIIFTHPNCSQPFGFSVYHLIKWMILWMIDTVNDFKFAVSLWLQEFQGTEEMFDCKENKKKGKGKWFHAYRVHIQYQNRFSLLLILLVRLFWRKKGGNNPDDNEIAFSTRFESRPARADTWVNTGVNSSAKECHQPLISFKHFIVFARDLKFSRRKLILAALVILTFFLPEMKIHTAQGRGSQALD